VYRILVKEPGGKRLLVRPSHKWIDNIKMDFLEIELGGVDWIGLPQDRNRRRALVNAVLNLRVPYNVEKLLSDYTTNDLLSDAQLYRVS
jgi:hypothetical protein